MQLRESTEADISSIFRVYLDAFADDEAESVAQLVTDLFKDNTATPLLSLVAEQDGNIAGHVIFSPVTIADHPATSAYILAPLAVTADQQGKGIGTALIERGLTMLNNCGVALVLVYGDPAYYSRFGFETGHGIRAPYELQYPEGWMARELKPGIIGNIDGTIRCAASFMSPQYW